jgi:glycosyltransferase involved in cell wall biosynthesis
VAAGNYVPVKQFDRLIGAVQELRRRGIGVPLILYGRTKPPVDPAHQRRLEALAAATPGVELRDHDPQWRDALRGEDVFVHAAGREAFGIVVLEAFARGCRVVVPEGLFLPELGLAPPVPGVATFPAEGTEAGLAEALAGALQLAEPAARLWEQRRPHRELFAPAAAGARLGALYARVGAGRGGR